MRTVLGDSERLPAARGLKERRFSNSGPFPTGVAAHVPGSGEITGSRVKTEAAMSKVVECAQVDPSSGCTAVIRGKDEQEVMTKAAEHAKQHGIRQVSPEMQAKMKAAIHEE